MLVSGSVAAVSGDEISSALVFSFTSCSTSIVLSCPF
jgi:hypothetical protein